MFLVALAAWSWQVFEYGQQHAGLDSPKRDRIEDDLRARIGALEAERDSLRASAARFERAGQIDRAAAEGVQSEVRSLQGERADLKREVAFLKSLVSGDDTQLVLDGQRLLRLGAQNYRFEATLSKRTEDDGTVDGLVLISVTGNSGDLLETLDMADLTDGKRSNIGIKFKNFQKLKTDIILPEGFVPSEIEVRVQPTGKTYKSFVQTYDWLVDDD